MRRILNFLVKLRRSTTVGTFKNKLGFTKDLKAKKCDTPKTQATISNNLPNLTGSTWSNEVHWTNLKRALLLCNGQVKPSTSTEPTTDAGDGILVNILELQRFVSHVFVSLDVPTKAANEMADALIGADYMGQRSMGIHRLPVIVAELLNTIVDPFVQPKLLSERVAIALVDGQNAPGPVVGNFCMELAIRKAREQGIGYVAARRSNNIGWATWYACQAMAHHMIGFCMSNGPPILVPKGGIQPILGSNPIAFAAACAQEQFITDLDMSANSIEQLELDYSNGQLQNLSANVALDYQGQSINCAAEALRTQHLCPFKPAHKSFGLAAMVDVLCGVMTGAQYATQIRRHILSGTDNEPANLGQIYVAIDPMHFCVTFEKRLADFNRLLRSLLPRDVSQPPLIPGEKEMKHMQMVDDHGGLTLSSCTLSVLQELSERFNIEPVKTRNNSK